jgi:uncharacterized glyoxalase superfamily protein PhnB
VLKNRSVPTDAILPHITYENVDQAIAWLTRTFDFKEHYRYGQPVAGAQLYLGHVWIMVNSARPGRASPATSGCATQCLAIFVDDVAAHFEKAKARGCKIVEDLHDTAYGERQYGVEDVEGHLWLFSQHVRDVHPTDWGAVMAT